MQATFIIKYQDRRYVAEAIERDQLEEAAKNPNVVAAAFSAEDAMKVEQWYNDDM